MLSFPSESLRSVLPPVTDDVMVRTGAVLSIFTGWLSFSSASFPLLSVAFTFILYSPAVSSYTLCIQLPSD